MGMQRRTFCKLAGLGTVGLVGVPGAGAFDGESPRPALEDVREPILGRRWAMVVDLQACRRQEGCRDCIAACHAVHNVPDVGEAQHEVKWIWKEPYAEAFPDQHHDYMAHDLQHEPILVFCNHCEDPPCTRVCPTRATWKREDGIVMMDWHRCIGCRYCVAACPYGSRSFNWQDPRPFLENPVDDFPTRTRGVVEKCTFCADRLSRGELPACVEACTSGCLAFGDLADPDSDVRRLLSERHAIRRRPGLGTGPAVYYLV